MMAKNFHVYLTYNERRFSLHRKAQSMNRSIYTILIWNQLIWTRSFVWWMFLRSRSKRWFCVFLKKKIIDSRTADSLLKEGTTELVKYSMKKQNIALRWQKRTADLIDIGPLPMLIQENIDADCLPKRRIEEDVQVLKDLNVWEPEEWGAGWVTQNDDDITHREGNTQKHIYAYIRVKSFYTLGKCQWETRED